jgi:sulfate adenylyltransferase (ADP) / ATP adenylyltransferase
MQLWPYPDEKELGFELFPNQATDEHIVKSDIPKVPFLHYVLRLPWNAGVEVVVEAYRKLRHEVEYAHSENGGGRDYNVVLTKEWMCLVPRRHSGLEKGAGANSATMMGMVWLTNDSELVAWHRDGPVAYLQYLGIPHPSVKITATVR